MYCLTAEGWSCVVSLPTVFAVNELSTRKNVDSKNLIRVSLPRPFSVDC